MKKRTPEESAAYFREYRARKKATAGVPAAPLPKKGATPSQRNTQTATPKPDHCANCADLVAEVSRLRDRIATLEDQLAKGSRATPTPAAVDKIDHINTYGKGHNIGRIPV
jgi:hypothetical protein